ncbi:MAG TPA: tetratricopeptide repeat protein [Pyrinomonadaceae bacterium]|nr:tetratricopeptide repeat protein [Pyrinomonadaceae bacterium]
MSVASTYIQSGEGRKALDYYNEALLLLRAAGDKDGEIGVLTYMGGLSLALGDARKGLEYQNQALTLEREIGDRPGEGRTLASIGASYFALGDKERALADLSRALPILRAVGDKYGEAVALTTTGSVYEKLGDRRKALEHFHQALALYRAAGSKNGEAGALLSIGNVYSVLGENQKALDYLLQSLPLQRTINSKSGEASNLLELGAVYWGLSDNQKALEFYNQALQLHRASGDKLGEVRALGGVGLVYLSVGEKQKALEYLNQTLPLARASGDKDHEATALSNIGSVYARLGEYKNAIDYITQALALARATGDKSGEATILNNIGAIYGSLEGNQKALEFLNQALAIHRATDNKYGEATTLGSIGAVHNRTGERQRALECLNQALRLQRDVGDRSGEASTLGNIGTIYYDSGQFQTAFDYYSQSLALRRSIGDKHDEAASLNSIGGVYVATGERQKALESYNQALLLRRAVGDRSGEASTLRNLQGAWQLLGNPRLAVFFGKQAVNKYQELRQAIQTFDKETQATYLKAVEPTYRVLADLLIQEGRFAQAEQVLRMLKEEEYFDFVRRDAEEIKNLKQRVRLDDKEQKLIERYAVLAERVTEIGQKLSTLQERMALLSRNNLELSPDEQKQFDELSAQISDANAAFRLFLEKELAAELGPERKKEIEVDRNLQEKLRRWGAGTVALYTVVAADRYRVILTTPTVQVDGKTEIKAAELNEKIFAFRKALQDLGADPRPLGKELYDILIKPIEKELQAADAQTLVWSLDGTLRYVPLAALSPDQKSYLVEKYQNVIITPKTRDDVSAPGAGWRALGLGVSVAQTVADPDDPGGKIDFAGLPGARAELAAIVRDEQAQNETGVLAGRRFLDDGFTARAMTESLAKETPGGERKFTVIHIASHFRLGSKWSNSFLLLGSGQMLTLEEVSNSPNIRFGGVELITLSACNTALAEETNGKEVDSLAEAIQTKDGKAVLATLWSVADESTQLLMSEFYRLRGRDPKLTKARAMQLAQWAMIKGDLKPSADGGDNRAEVAGSKGKKPARAFARDPGAPFAHPYFWSPFVLFGIWR